MTFAPTNQPPLTGIGIPQIQKAYENDPRTKLAQIAMQNGSSTAPVVGVYDGLARVLQGAMGGYANSRQQKKYRAEDEASRGTFNDMLAKVLGGSAGPGTAGGEASPVLPGATGAGVPPVALPVNAPTPPPVPQAPAQPVSPAAPMAAPGPSQPVQGGAGGLPPLGQMMGAGSAPAPAAQAPPDGLPPMPSMPTAPDTGAAQESMRKKMGMALLGMNNPYFFEQGLEQLNAGVQDEAQSAEKAADRKYDLNKTTYTAGLDNYYSAQQEQRKAGYGEVRAQKDFTRELSKMQKEFGYDMSKIAKQEAGANYRAGLSARTSIQVAAMNNDADLKKTLITIDASKGTAAEKTQAKRQAFLSTAAGSKIWDAGVKSVQKNDELIGMLEQYKQVNKKVRTGGMMAVPLLGPTLKYFGAGGYGELDAITQKIVPSLRVAGDILSDSDKVLYMNSVSNIRQRQPVSDKVADRVIRFARRSNEFERAKIESMTDGSQGNFLREWDAYKRAVSLDKDVSFPQWKESLPKFNAQGQRVN